MLRFVGEVLHLVPRKISRDSLEAATHLVREIHAANVVGYVAIYLLPGQDYIIEIVGECRNVPALMRGLVKGADDELKNLIRPNQ